MSDLFLISHDAMKDPQSTYLMHNVVDSYTIPQSQLYEVSHIVAR